jgi:RNA polymerase sigma factor (TIGR02999 family)
MEEADGFADIFAAAAQGDQLAIGRLFAILYPDLREQAHRRIRALPNVTMLDTTSLVNESYLRFSKAGKLSIADRKHFLAYAAHVMRSVVVDYVRQARTQRRGGDEVFVTLNTNLLNAAESPAEEVILLDEFLQQLAAVDARLVSIVEMRYFACLENDEIAECFGVTSRTIRRDLEKARLLLLDASE